MATTPGCAGSGINGTGTVLANMFDGGTGTYMYIAIDNSEANAIADVSNPLTRITLSGAGSYTWTSKTNGDYWVALMDSAGAIGLSAKVTVSCTNTTTTTTTAAPTTTTTTIAPTTTTTTLAPTTTTTTLPPLVVTNGAVTCTTITGAWRSSFTGGNGVYSFVAYADSQANAAIAVNGGAGSRVTLGSGATYYDWTGIANGTWYVAVKTSDGGISVQNTPVVVNCTTTTTTTTAAPTTTTTTATPTTTTTTTTTTTLPPITYGTVATCTGLTQTLTINTLAGGNGTFYMNDTTYADAPSAASGPTTLVTDAGGTARTFTGQPNGGRYVFILSGTVSTMVLLGNNCTTTTTTTTAAPTTTTTTAAPTTTTTTQAPFYDIVNYDTDTTTACYGAAYAFSMTGNGTTFCNSTSFSSSGWYSVPTGNYVLQYLGQTLNVSHVSGQNYASVYGGGCQTCPATTTTTTAAPTTTTTTTVAPTTTTTTVAPTTTTTTEPPASYYNAQFVWASNSVSCSSTSKTKVFVWLNAADYATFIANGSVLFAGAKWFSNSSGTTWNTSSYSKAYDDVAYVVWNASSTNTTVNVEC